MFFVVRSNDSFNFPPGLIKYIVTVVVVVVVTYKRISKRQGHHGVGVLIAH